MAGTVSTLERSQAHAWPWTRGSRHAGRVSATGKFTTGKGQRDRARGVLETNRSTDRWALVGEIILPDAAGWSMVDAGESVLSLTSLSAADALLDRDRKAIDCVLIDVESCGGINRIIDALMKFRLRRPETPVILASRDAQSDDLSTVRLAIADATVRLPLSHARTAEAIATARENNRIWQGRLECRDKPDQHLQ